MCAREFRSLILFYALDNESRIVRKVTSLDKTFDLLVRRPHRPRLYTKQVYNMVEVEELEVHILEYQKIEELFGDRVSEVFDTILLNGPVETIKTNLN